VLTLALGIGANAAVFSLVRGVLLRPLVNRDEDRLIYIQQSARGIGAENLPFSVPEIDDLASLHAFHGFNRFWLFVWKPLENVEGRLHLSSIESSTTALD
jgi:hypothetical protein